MVHWVEIGIFFLKGALYKVPVSIFRKLMLHWSKVSVPYNRPCTI